MIITDYNEMSVEELATISNTLGIAFVVNDGKIVNAERKH